MAKADPVAQRDPASMNYEEAFQELRSVVQSIEAGTLPLDESLQAFERGTALLKRCRAVLDDAELKVRELTAADLGGGKTA